MTLLSIFASGNREDATVQIDPLPITSVLLASTHPGVQCDVEFWESFPGTARSWRSEQQFPPQPADSERGCCFPFSLQFREQG